MQNKQKQGKSSRSQQQKTFSVTAEGHRLALTIGQIMGDKSSWTTCHGTASDGTQVNSLKVKRIGNTVFIRDNQNRIAGFKTAELDVALPKLRNLIDGKSANDQQ